MSVRDPEAFAMPGAACAIYRDAPSLQGKPTGAIGSFTCDSTNAGASLLRSVMGLLQREGFEAVLGPMDGDTWHTYRVVSESDGSPSFLLEPVSGPFDLAAFQAAGFAPVSSYVSAKARIEDAIGEPAPAVPGIMVSAWDGRSAEALIGNLFDLSGRAFANNAFYKPITREAFLKLYEPVLPTLDPRLIFFARTGEKLAGYLFALPDYLQGARPATAIIKTYASGVRGVGHMLIDRAHRTFRDLGYTHVIHALMHVDNQSRERSRRHHGTLFRRYDLMAAGLDT